MRWCSLSCSGQGSDWNAALDAFVSRREPRVAWIHRSSRAIADNLVCPLRSATPSLRERGRELIRSRYAPLIDAP
jgi:hypothetical protein